MPRHFNASSTWLSLTKAFPPEVEMCAPTKWIKMFTTVFHLKPNTYRSIHISNFFIVTLS